MNRQCAHHPAGSGWRCRPRSSSARPSPLRHLLRRRWWRPAGGWRRASRSTVGRCAKVGGSLAHRPILVPPAWPLTMVSPMRAAGRFSAVLFPYDPSRDFGQS